MDPMLADPARPTQLPDIASSSEWALELKVDGERLAATTAAGPVGYNRDGRITKVPTPILRALSALDGYDLTLDGERVGDTWVVFDLPEFAGVVEQATPWCDRRAALEALFAIWDPDPAAVRLMPVALTIDEKAAMISRTLAGRGEGLMAKRVDSPYKEYKGGPRGGAWLKIKKQHTVDCVVDWVSDPTTGTGRWNMGLQVYRDGELVDVGEVGRLTGDGMNAEPGSVVEVRVLYTTENGRLYQPTMPKLRHDKRPEECTWDQMEAARTDRQMVLSW